MDEYKLYMTSAYFPNLFHTAISSYDIDIVNSILLFVYFITSTSYASYTFDLRAATLHLHLEQ